MSKTIDERVVSMQFDNRNFETNVKTSLSTLDKLKEKLNFKGATDGLENISAAASKVNMNPLAAGIETVSVKFSALEVMAVTALSNITNQAIETGKRLVKSLSTDQMTTGWQKYEQKTASVQTIMNATGKSIDEVSKYLDHLMKYSDETSYGFTDMTQSLAQLTAAGGDIEKLIPMIEGIANATAFAGKGAAEFSRSIYNLNQSYTSGALKYMDWKSLELAGVASKQLKEVFIETAEALGKITEGEVTLANFNETLKNDWADTEVMEAAFGRFAELTEAAIAAVDAGDYDTVTEAIEALADSYDDVAVKSFKAAQEAKSFTEAIDATKDAVSSQWMKTYELVFGNKEQATKIWTELCNGLWDVFASGGERRNEVLSSALGSKWKSFTDVLGKVGISSDSFSEKLIELARNDEEAAKLFNNGVDWNGVGIDKLLEKYGSLEEVLASGELFNGESLVNRTLEYFNTVSTGVDDVTGKLEEYQELVNGVIRGDFGNGGDRYTALEEAGKNYSLVQGLVEKVYARNGGNFSDTTITIEDLTEAISELSEEELKNLGFTEKEVDTLSALKEEAEKTGVPLEELIAAMMKPSGGALLIDSLRNALGGLKDIILTVKDAWARTFHKSADEDEWIKEDADNLYKLVEKIHDFSEALRPSEATLSKLSRIFQGLFSILGIFKDVIVEIGSSAFGLLSDSVGEVNFDLLEFLAGIGDSIVAFREWINEDNRLGKAIEFISTKLKEGVSKVREWIDAFMQLESVQNVISTISSIFGDSWESIKAWFEGLSEVEDLPGYIIDGLVNGLIGGVSAVWDAAIALGKAIIDGFCEFMGIHSPSWEMQQRGEYVTEGLANGIESGADTIFDKAIELGKKIIEGIKEALGLGDGSSSETEAAGEEASQGFLDGFISKFENINWSKIFGGIMAGGLLVAVLNLSTAIKDIASMFGGVGDVLEATATVVKTFAKVEKAFAKVLTGVSWKLKASAIKDIAISILMLVGALAVLTALTYTGGHLWAGLGALVVIVGLFAGLIYGLNKLSGKTENGVKVSFELGKLALAMIGMAAALLLLTGVVGMLSLMSTFGDGLMKMVGLLVTVGAFMKIMSSVMDEDDVKNISKLSGCIAKLSFAMLLLAGLVAILCLLPDGAMDVAISFAVGFLGFVFILSEISKFAEKGLDALGSMILKMAVSMLILAAVVKIAGTFTSDEMINGINFALGFLTFVIILTAIGKYAENELSTVGKTLLSMAASMLIMALVVKLLGNMSPTEALTGIIGLLAVVVILVGVIHVLKTVEKDAPKIALTLLAMASAIGILAVIAAVLGILPLDNILKGCLGIVLIASAMAIMMYYAKDLKDCKGTIIAMAVAIGVMAVALAALAFIPWQGLLVSVVAMAAVMAVLSLVIYEASKLKDAKGVLGPLIVMTVAIGLIGAMIALIANQPLDGALVAAVSLSLVMLALGGAIALIGKYGDASINAMACLMIMVVAMGIIGVVLYLLAKADPIGMIAAAVALGIIAVILAASMSLLGDVAPTAILAAAGMLVMSVALIAIAAALKILSTVPFDALMNGTLALVAIIAALAIGAAIMEAVGAGAIFLSVALIALSVAVLIAAAGAYIFAQALAIISAALPSLSDGLVQLFTSVSNCTPQITDFCNALVNIGSAALIALLSISLGLLALAGSAVVFSIAGLALAAVILVLAVAVGVLALALLALAVVIAASVLLVAGAASLFGQAGQYLIEGFINGINSMIGAVGECISGFVSGVVGWFCNLLGIHSPSTVMQTIGKYAGEGFALGIDDSKGDVENSSSGLVDSFISGITDKLGDSSFDLGSMFGSSFAKGIDDSSDEASNAGGNFLTNLISQLTKSEPDYEDAGSGGAKSYARGFRDVGESEMSVLDGPVDDVISNIKDKDSGFEDSGLGNIMSWVNGSGSGWGDGLDLTNMNLGDIQSLISGEDGTFSDLGLGNMLNYDSGLSTGGDTAESTAGSTASSAAQAMGNTRNEFQNAGVLAGKGFAQGLSSQQSVIVSKATSMAQAAAAAVSRTLEIHSPSRVFYSLGSFAGMGFINALSDYESIAGKAGEGVATEAVSGMTSAIARITDIINSDIDSQPTIRPVMDLSDVVAGAGTIGGLLSMNPTIGAMANVRAISSSMSGGQNGATNDVVSAIADLGRNLNRRTGDTYNINGITYDDGSNVSNAVATLVRAARIERRV